MATFDLDGQVHGPVYAPLFYIYPKKFRARLGRIPWRPV